MRKAAPPRFTALVGLGFGDCGKGLYTDALCRRWGATCVVRFNGGAQAGHNVVLQDGRHHTFSQFGAGSFVAGVKTLLSADVVVHPTALQVEAEVLREAGFDAAPLTRVAIDERCRLTTPYHQAAGRLREWSRGSRAHGSCGVGVGETVRHALMHPAMTLRYGDLARPERAREKLAAIRHTLAADFDLALWRAGGGSPALEAFVLADDGLADDWLVQALALAKQVPPLPASAVHQLLRKAEGPVVFEGAQGMLLDEDAGFHPHTSWSRVGPAAAQALLTEAGIDDEPMLRLGVLRSHLTRHGAGPLPTQDPALDAWPEPHNRSDSWQGAFRRGHPDAVLLRHALRATGPLDGLLLSHADALQRLPRLRWCRAYQVEGSAVGDEALCEREASHPAEVLNLVAAAAGDLAHASALTRLLERVRPVYDEGFITSLEALVNRLEANAACRVMASSTGPCANDITWRDVHDSISF